LDSLVSDESHQYLRHYLIDFGSTLGSAGGAPQEEKAGWEYTWDPGWMALRIATFGIFDRKWVRARYAIGPSIGRLDFKHFNPGSWKPRYPNPAFRNALPDDCAWAAKIVMAFSDDDIRAIVRTGELSNPKAEEQLIEWLIFRRDRIGDFWLNPPNS